MGAPKAKIDWKVVGDMLAAGCRGTEVAASIGIAPYTLYERCSEDKGILFTHFAQECREKGNSMLHAAQFKNAMKGNTSMQIWLGKQRLGQRDKEEPDKNPPNDIIIALQNQLMELQALLLKHGIHHKPQAESQLPRSDETL